MNMICRFCLNVSTQGMCNFTKACDIFCKFQSWLSIQISFEETFPNQICKECVNKIEQINEFCLNIKENDKILQQCLVNGSLQDYYLRLTNNIHIKEENEHTIFCESKYLKLENPKTYGSLDIEINTEKREDTKNINDINFSECENIKIEESIYNDYNSTACSSDEDITLSSMKKHKELNTNAADETHKRIKRIKSRKSPKSQKKCDMQKNTDSNPNSVKQFTCLTCKILCDSQTDLIKHYHDEHLNKCKPKTAIIQKYTENKFDDINRYKCDSCEKTCKNKKDIVKHLTIHDDERPLICKLCGRTYKTVTEIIRHARVHNGFKLQCSYKCGYTTAYQGALREHENRHQDVYKYTCKECGKGFYVKTWYEQHQNIHNGSKPFVCDICGLAFHMDRYLTAHRSLIHPQSSSVKRYICVHCNQKCDSANSLALHLAVHGINKEKDFLCDFCGKILSSADQLKYHHRMHLGVKPYSCSICNKTFAKKFNVKVHMTSHSGEKTHACTRCGKRYTQRSTLLRHLKRHHATSSPKRNG